MSNSDELNKYLGNPDTKYSRQRDQQELEIQTLMNELNNIREVN